MSSFADFIINKSKTGAFQRLARFKEIVVEFKQPTSFYHENVKPKKLSFKKEFNFYYGIPRVPASHEKLKQIFL